MLTVTKAFDWCYAHHLPDYKGKCKRMHGHNSRVEVEFRHDVQKEPYPTMAVDFSRIKEVVGGIIEQLDHTLLNDVLAHPTAEAITKLLVERIKQTDLGPQLERVRVSETPTSWAEWTNR